MCIIHLVCFVFFSMFDSYINYLVLFLFVLCLIVFFLIVLFDLVLFTLVYFFELLTSDIVSNIYFPYFSIFIIAFFVFNLLSVSFDIKYAMEALCCVY